MMDRAKRKERLRALSRIALRLARSADVRGVLELRAGRFRIYEFSFRDVTVEFWKSLGDDMPSQLRVKAGNVRALYVEWTKERVTRTSYKPGRWEQALAIAARRRPRVDSDLRT